MFNTLDENFFVCQSLLKERRRPSGGLREALKESLGGRVSTPLSSRVELKITPGASEVRFHYLRKMIGYCFVRNCPIGAFPVGASFLLGTMKGLF